MNSPIFQNAVGTIFKESIQVKNIKICINDLSVMQYIMIKNGKTDFFLILTSIFLFILFLILNSLLIIFLALIIAIISQLINIKYYYLVFGIHKNQEIIIKGINKVKEQDIKLFIEQFKIVKELNTTF
jgi:hypothetical protein